MLTAGYGLGSVEDTEEWRSVIDHPSLVVGFGDGVGEG